MKLLVHGDKSFKDSDLFFRHIDYIWKTQNVETIIEGGETYTDQLAEEFAKDKGIEHIQIKTEWDNASETRNERMLKLLGPNDRVLAFSRHDFLGADEMVKEAKQANIKVTLVHCFKKDET